ncbi:apolipophorins-like isoform X2 [Eurosta solidaginis]|uniref:apolipophorins-like isoform X2 n=1 Tax=Eurosta solidaginis TaxID=178769 RepID=UPI0035311696
MKAFNSYVLNIVLVCMFALGLANSEHICKRGCSQSDNGILKYRPGNVYEYSFDSSLAVAFSKGISSDPDDMSIKIQGSAKVFAENNCGYTLQLNAVKVSTTKEGIEKKLVQNIQKPVYFNLVNGKVESQLCGESSDSQYSLNIKRALISLFQSSPGDGTETDVFGQCATHTSISSTDGAQIVTKVRDLNKCAYRENSRSSLIHGIVKHGAGIKSSNLFKASYIKKSKISNAVVELVHLVEEYEFDVTEKSLDSVRGKIVTNLKVKNTDGVPATSPSTGTQVTSIIFHNPEPYRTKNLNALKTSLAKLVTLLDGYVKKDSAKAFIEFIRLMRSADTDTLLELASVSHDSPALSRKVYMDALFRTGTSDSVKAILKQISKMDEKEKLMAIISINHVQTVDKDTLNQAALLLVPNAPKQIYLSIGLLAGKYCSLNGCESGDLDIISKKFVDNLKHCKASTRRDEDRIVTVLKGIANMGTLNSRSAAVLAECASSGRAVRIRVAALQAFGSARCESVVIEKALSLLRDRNDDSEIRIEAYLAAINCPTADLAMEIENIVNSEPIYQVGGFIASSLKTIRDSTDDNRQYQRYHLGNIRITKHFPKNPKRYSYNNEVSFKLDAVGFSGSSDYNLIYSQHGFLPRSAKLNVTAELFGTQFNFLEATARQENLENVMEYYFGPKGLFNKDFDAVIKMIDIGGVSGNDPRIRRSISDDTAKFSKKYKAYGSRSTRDVSFDFSLKFFGSEMCFLSLGDQIPSSLDEIFKYFSSSFDNLKKQLSSFHKEFILHNLFLDLNVIYPTGLGFPFELNTQGFAANKVDIGIHADIDTIIEENWLAPKYQLKLVPSVEIALKFQIGFNAYVLAAGLQLDTNLHSATGADVKFNFMNEGTGFNLHIESPRNKLELINAEVIPGFYMTELDKPIKHALKTEAETKPNAGNYSMCLNQLESIGLSLCIDTVGIPIGKEYGFNAAGTYRQVHPVSIKLYTDVEKIYVIRASYTSQQKSGPQEWKIELNTPGSRGGRTTTVKFELGSGPHSYGRLDLNSPVYKLAIETGLNNDDQELVLYALYEDNNNVKRKRIGFLRSGNEFRPLVATQEEAGVSNEIYGYSMDGKIVSQKKGDGNSEYTFENFRITHEGKERVIVNGLMGVGQGWFKNELHIGVDNNAYLVKGNLKVDNGIYDVGLFVNDESSPDYIYGGSAHVQITDQAFGVHFIGSAAVWNIDINSKLQYTLSESTTEIASSSFKHDITLRKRKHIISLLKLYGITSGTKKFEFNGDMVSGKSVAALSVKYNSIRDTQGVYFAELHGKYNKHLVDVISKSDFNGNCFLIDNTMTTSWGTLITVRGEIGRLYTAQDIYIDVYGIIQLSKKNAKLQWTVKMIGEQEKIVSEIKMLRDNVDFLKYNGELQYLQDKLSAGKIVISIKNFVTAKGDFRVAKNGKGDANFDIESQISELKHKLDVNLKFEMQAPKYAIEATIKLDGVKQLLINTDSYMDEVKISTKSFAEVLNQKIALDAQITNNNDLRTGRDLQGSFVLICPSGYAIDGKIKQKITSNAKTGNLHSNMEIKLGETLDSKKRTLIYTANTEKMILKTKEISHNVNLLFTNFDLKKLALAAFVKHLPKGQSKLIEIQTSIRDDFFNISSDTKFVIDQVDNQHTSLLIELKSGSAYNCKVTGRYSFGSHDVSSKFEIQGNANFTSNITVFHINANGMLLKPSSENGTYILKLDIEKHDDDGQFTYWNTMFNGTKRQGACALDWKTKDGGPLKLEASYKHDGYNIIHGSSSTKQRYWINLNYGNQFLNTVADLSYIGLDEIDVHYTLKSNFRSVKNLDMGVHLKKLEPKTFEIKWQAKRDDMVYSSDSRIYQSEFKRGVELHIVTPTNPIAIVGIFETSGENKSNILIEIENLLSLDFLYHAEFLYRAVEDFYIKSKWNSEKLKLQNYDLDVHSQGKSIVFNMKHAQGVILAGSATYSQKMENSKRVIEGNGQVQYKGKPQMVNFRLIHQIYDLNVDKEIGFSYILDSTFGPKKSVSSLKITNKDFDAKFSICEEKKQCTNVQVESIVYPNIRDEVESPHHSFLIVVDLRELGYPYEFEFQSKTIRKGWQLQYSLDSQIISSNNFKYKLVITILPKISNIEIIMPKRDVVLEIKHQYPGQGKLFGHYENSILFFFDKANNPNKVMCFKAVADVNNNEFNALIVNSEIKFEHPSLRPLTASGKLEVNHYEKIINSEIIFDIFCLPDQKIVGTFRSQSISQENGFNVTTFQSLKSTGMGFNYQFSGHAAFNMNPQTFSAGAILQSGASNVDAVANINATNENSEASIYVANEPILVLTTMFNREKYAVEVNSKLQVLGQAPIAITANLHPIQSRFTVKQIGLVDMSAGIEIGKELKLNIQGIDKLIFNGSIALDADNFLQATYTNNSDDIKSFLSTVEVEIKKDTDLTMQKIKDQIKHVLEKREELKSNCTSCLSNLKISFEENINEVVLELGSDPVFKQINEEFKKINSIVIEIGDVFLKGAAEIHESLQETLSGFYENIQKILSETIIPAGHNLLKICSTIFGDFGEQVMHFITTVVQEAFNALEKYTPELKNYAKAVTQALKTINEGGLELVKIASETIEQFFGELREWLKTLPTIETLKNYLTERMNKLRLMENTLALINNFLDKLHILPLTQESSEFIDKLRQYVEAKLSNTPIDNEQADELANLFLNAVSSLWSNMDFKSLLRLPRNILAPIFDVAIESLKVFDHLSCLFSFRFNVFNFLLNENWKNSFLENRIYPWVFFHDFKLRGLIADGHQILSFDGYHYSFPGICKYILAQDSVDNNFTVIAQLNNGKLKSIVLTDRDGGNAEITDSGALKIFGDQVEYPQHVKGVHAWRLFYTVWIYSEYGVKLMCTLDLRVCHVEVNGFYTSKIRGLLGNGNAEPYDDLVQVDGTIAADYVAFGNGYGIGKCASLTLQSKETILRSELCSDIFSLESPMLSGYLFENVAPYRAICDAAVAEASDKEKEMVACTIATAYGSALKLMNIPTRLPSRCIKCPGSAGQRELGQKFTVKIPGNKADIVFVVDMDVNPIVLGKLVAPVILEIRDSLKTRGFNDVQISVIAYNESQLYPAVLTSDGGKTNYKGNITAALLNGPKNFCIHCASQEIADQKVVEIFKNFEFFLRSIIPQSDEKAFRLAIDFPFRAGAAKSIVGVRSNTSNFVNLLQLFPAHLTDSASTFNVALLHLIGPVRELSVEGIPRDKVIGFNSRLIATMDGKDAKKRQKLHYENNKGIEFVLQNGGWVFSTQNFDQLKPNEQKRNLNQVANTLADTLFRTEIVAECECETLHGLYAKHQCNIKSSNFVPNKKIKAN